MTHRELLRFALDADPVHYWGAVSAWRPPALTARPALPDSSPIIRLAVIPPIAGGAPGLVDDIVNAIKSIVYDHIIKPVVEYLARTFFSIFTSLTDPLSINVRAILRPLWMWWRGLWWPWISSSYRPDEPDEWFEDGAPIHYALTSLIRYPFLAAISLVLSWVYWIRDRITDARDYVAGWIDTALSTVGRWLGEVRDVITGWIDTALSTTGRWLGEVRDVITGWIDTALSTAGRWLTEARDVITGWIDTALSTVGRWLGEVRDFVVDKMWTTVMAGGAALVEGLRDAFEFVAGLIGDAITAAGDALVAGFQYVFLGPAESLVNTVNKKLAIPGRLIRGEYPNLVALVDDLVDPGPAIIAGIAGAILLGMLISMVTASIMTILVQPLTEPHVQAARAGVGAQLLQPVALQEARNRELIDDTLVESHLSRAGYSGPAKDALAEMRHRIPGPSDLVRFAVREAFDKSLADQLGFVTPLPGDFSLWMERQGFAEEWSERYWWSHWDLPSVGQGFEMLHRGVIPQPDLELLLRAKDVAPLWQQRLIDIAYTLPSRVDLRRMLKVGIITETDVLKGYSDRGYDSFWARALTDYAVDWSTPEDESELDELKTATAAQIRLGYRRLVIDRGEALDRLVLAGYGEAAADYLLSLDDAQMAVNPFIDGDIDVRDLTRATLLEAYREGVLDRDRVQAELEVQGYLPGSADLLLTLEDVANAKSLTRARRDLIRERYVTYEISEATAVDELTLLGTSDAWRDLLIEEWTIDRQKGVRRLTTAQLRKANSKGVITDQAWLDGLLVLGYSPVDAAILILSEIPEPDIVLPEPPPEPPPEIIPVAEREVRLRELERSMVERLYNQTLIDGAEVLQRFAYLRFIPQDADLLLRRLDDKLSQNKTGQPYRLGQATRADTVLQYRLAGFAETDAERIVAIIDEDLEAQRELQA